ncbi:Kinetochore protein spc7 [Ceratocystis fimbriata CBS 114723]|uniref:Kinetochore protein spc7 n=1 Tax=Ceratocystis fimbriata CBS 114723 TaxID=1035309 RepID=A0A2C5WV88_9PEZI|nr:Kinetochore protein spc7 [Ceratocystis fimbriata CBS 114723]
MLPAGDQTLPAARRIRKSIGSLVRRSDEKENATIDIVENLGVNRKKSRSKSIGPGGLDALKQGTSKRRASLAVPARLPPRSILKPASSLIPEIPPSIKQNKKNTATTSSGSIGSSNNVFSIGADPLSNVPEVPQGSKVALRTEEQQQKAARDREERERRAARRKSLANRRVSFAAEATLHTFHEIEYMQDSTASTDHTHQKSSAAASAKNTGRLAEEATDKAQSRTRRSSTGLQPMSSRNNNDDDTMASTVYGSSDSELVEDVEEESSNSDSDADDGTMMSVEVEEMTSASVGSIMESPGLDPDQQDKSDTLENVLRLAARQAGTQRLGDDEEEEEEIIPSFGWAKKPAPKAKPAVSTSTPALDTPTPGDGTQTMDVDMDMDMTTAMGGILRPGQSAAARQNNPQPTEMMDMTMDVTKAVGGILSRQMNEPLVAITHDYSQDEATMEFTTALGAIKSRASSAPGEVDENEDMSMELTTVMGSVLPSALSAAASQRQQTLARVQNEDNTTSAMSMDLDMDMEMTTAMGGILNRRISLPDDDEDAQHDGQTMTMGMDITAAVGRILGTGVSTSLEPEEDETFGMEMTTVLGGILAKSQTAVAPVQDVTDQPLIDLSIAAEAPSELPEISSPFRDPQSPARSYSSSPFKSPERSPPSLLSNTVAMPPSKLAPATAPELSAPDVRVTRSRSRSKSPEKSPPKPVSLRRSTRSRSRSQSPSKPMQQSILPSTTPTAPPPPIPNVLDPSPRLVDLGQSAVVAAAPEMPATPMDIETPLKPFNSNALSSPSGSPSLARANRQAAPRVSQNHQDKLTNRPVTSLFQRDPETGNMGPSVVLTPQTRRLSGIGADKSGLGSPRVTAILDMRASLGESGGFVPALGRGACSVAFESPKAIEREVIEEEVRENAWRMAQKEAEGGEATLNLREMIQSLSPKKRPFSNRKSLHVGSARGLLGKRPAELDSEEEDNEARDGVKRLRGLPASPVKNVRLQQPPSKQETAAGRVSKTTATSGLESPDKQSTAATAITPKRDIAKFSNFLPTSDVTRTGQFDFEELPQLPPKDEGGDRIHLHDFLNMTSIRFMELNTTKRRHTIAPTKMDGSVMDFKADMSLERCVVAGACTVPMLELYQHSCRELKKYISEGRRIVREIETETFEENPPLFREYMSATPEFKALMDNQFKNVKTHARLLSKAMWYEWRMKLQDGIKEGLLRIREGMDDDQALVEKQEGLVASVLPAAVEKQETLTKEKDNIEAFVKEISACDPQELQTARDDLANTTDRIAAKRKEIENLKHELEETEADIASSIEYKKECQEAIVEAERIREECRGWSSVEINALKARVERLEKKHGWAVCAITGTQITMTYLGDIELVFDAAAFQRGQRNRPIDVSYIGSTHASSPQPSTPERSFFVSCIRDHLRCIPQSRTSIGDMLCRAAAAWDKCRAVCDDLRIANTMFPTRVVAPASGTTGIGPADPAPSISVHWSLLISQLETRVEIAIRLEARLSPDGVDVAVVPDAHIIYGEAFNTAKMLEFWRAKAGDKVCVRAERDKTDKTGWCDVLVDLQARLLARGRKERSA